MGVFFHFTVGNTAQPYKIDVICIQDTYKIEL